MPARKRVKKTVSKTVTITTTYNYGLFDFSKINRNQDVTKRKDLRLSMEKYGYLKSFPIVCYRINRQLVIHDGQHRLAMAEELGLPVSYVVEDVPFDIGDVNQTSKNWATLDYAQMYSRNGNKHYVEAMAFCKEFKIPVGIGFAILSGTAAFSTVKRKFRSGTFQIKEKEWATGVAILYTEISSLSKPIRTARLIEACMAVMRVEGFSIKRLVDGAKKRRDLLVPYATRDACLMMLEHVYNYNRTRKQPLKFEAIAAMKARNPANREKAAAEAEGDK